MSPAPRAPNGIKTVGLVSAPSRPGTYEFAHPLVTRLRRAGVAVLVDAYTDESCPTDCQRCSREELVAGSDMVIVMGGDGLLLGLARLAGPSGVPILGVDLGSFGFLAAAQPATVLEQLDRLLAGDYQIRERLMLSVQVRRSEQVTASFVGLNDAVISRIYPRRMVRLDTHVDGERVAVYPADGLIVSTPTGSTAYNLSAGGPLVDPDIECFILNPICPHTLYLRPLIVDADSVIVVAVQEHDGETETARLSVDGQEDVDVSSQDVVVIERAPFRAQLVRIDSGSFCERLHAKLRWGLER